MPSELWLIRHGETEWTLSGAHTGSTDIPLTDAGRRQALKLRESLAGRPFALVLASPLSRARETCEMAGFGEAAQIEPNLVEWRYGDYEERTTDEIHAQAPGWSLRQCLRIDRNAFLRLPVRLGFRRRLLDQLRHFSRMRQHSQMISR